MKVSSLEELYQSKEGGLAVMDHREDVYDALESVNGWRGLFDWGSHEYNESQHHLTESQKKQRVTRKWKVIERLKEFLECGLDGLVYLFVHDCNNEQDCYKFESIREAIGEYAKYFREAKEYLTKCKQVKTMTIPSRVINEKALHALLICE